MSEQEVADLELTDTELMEVLKNHGMDRRTLMKVFGAGAAVSVLGSTTAAAKETGEGPRIDKVYGAPYSADDTVPSGLVDHEVMLHIHEEDVHSGFPTDPESGEEIPAEFFFNPVGLHVNPGDVVQFHTHSGLHTTTAFHPKYGEPPLFSLPERVPTEYGFTSPPISEDDSWLYRFTEPGVYDLLCLPHLFLGMVMRIVVSGDSNVPTENYGALPFPNAGDVLDATELTPSNIVTEGMIEWEDLTL